MPQVPIVEPGALQIYAHVTNTEAKFSSRCRCAVILSCPQKIYRDSKQDQCKSWPCILRLIPQQDETDPGGHCNVERRQYRISESLIGTVGIRSLEAQHKQTNNGEDIEDKHGEDDVVEQLTVRPGYA